MDQQTTNRRMAQVAEHYGLEWVNVRDFEANPFGDIGHFARKDGVRSNDICLLDLQFTDAAKAMLKAELSKLLGDQETKQPSDQETEETK